MPQLRSRFAPFGRGTFSAVLSIVLSVVASPAWAQPVSDAEPPTVSDARLAEMIHLEPDTGCDCGGTATCLDCQDGCGIAATCGDAPGPYLAYERPHTMPVWFRGEALIWWTQGEVLPPLVTTSPDGTDQADAGVLGLDTTSTLFGGSSVHDGNRSGGRVSFGLWLQADRSLGIEASFLGLNEIRTGYQATSTGNPILARPFFNVQPEVGFATEDASLLAFPSRLEGSIDVDTSTEFQTVEVLLRRALYHGPCDRMDLLLGYRFARLDGGLRIDDDLLSTHADSGIAPQTTIQSFDLFNTRNRFHGPEIGVMARRSYARWSMELLMKVALGNTNSEVTINGSTTTTAPGGDPSTSTGGLLALDSNIGRYTVDDLALIPELGFTLTYDLTPRLKAVFGYTFIYWSRVVTPGSQIDTNLNLTQLPPGPFVGASQPEFEFVFDDFWAQGLSLGLDYQF